MKTYMDSKDGTLRELLVNLNKLIEENPARLDYKVLTSDWSSPDIELNDDYYEDGTPCEEYAHMIWIG